ncbi:MAG: hypothetical protein R3F03_07980 [Opitutaceae bacterium]
MTLLRYITLSFVAALAAQAATVSYSPPVGGARITFEPGTRFTGMPFLNPAVHQGTVSSNNGGAVTLSDAEANIGAKLSSGTAYYLEIISGPDVTYIGDRFEVDVSATIASANNTITASSGSTTNTMASLPELAGYSLVVRPHVTLGQLFGTKTNELMHGSTILGSADQVVFFNPTNSSYATYYYARNSSGSIAQWTLVGGGSTNRDNTPIPPGVGMIVHRKHTEPVTLTWAGEIRRNAFSQPLAAGLNLVAEAFPVASSPLNRGLTYANGVTGATILSQADQVLVYNGAGYDTYYLARNSTGSIEQWVLVGGGSTNHNSSKVFSPTEARFIRKILADPDYYIPNWLNL